MRHTIVLERTRPKQAYYLLSEPSSEWSAEANQSQFQHSQQSNPSSPLDASDQSTVQSYNVKPRYSSTPQRQPGIMETQRSDSRFPGLLLQPDSRPISQEQLASEVKSIYAGLTMVETKCIHVDRAQAAAVSDKDADPNCKIGSDHWQALIALHRTLLHEHHDFFLASQHPSASPALRRLASKYSMPARMWKHGIHSFLELLRRRLPESIDYMLAFIYLAYQMMALLYETVPAFEDTWIKCLGDLGRYRIAIEDEDVRDRETWAGVARSWYSGAADKNPSAGRLYHHLAILGRPNALQQLYYYSRSLTCVQPFRSAHESILTLLDPILGRPTASYSHALPIDTGFIQAHSTLFEKLPVEKFKDVSRALLSELDNHISRVTVKWKEQGFYADVANIAGLFEYRSNGSILRQILLVHVQHFLEKQIFSRYSSPSDEEPSQSQTPANRTIFPIISEAELPSKLAALESDFTFSRAYQLILDTIALLPQNHGHKNILPHAPILLDEAPWTEICILLNTLLKYERSEQILPIPVFPSESTDNLPLPEDYLIRGQIWSQWYFPEHWFAREYDEEDSYLELASNIRSRVEGLEMGDLHIKKTTAWLDLAYLRTTWNAQLEKLVMHCRDLCVLTVTACVRNYFRASSLALGILFLSKKRRRSPSLGFMSVPLVLNYLVPGAAAQTMDTVTNSNWRQRAIDTLSELLVASAALLAPTIILVLTGLLAAALLWAEAEGILCFFMLIMAIVFAAIRPEASSTAKESDYYIRLAVGLGYITLMLAYCRVVMMQPKHKKAPKSKKGNRKYGKIFCTVAAAIGIIVTIVVMAFPGSRECWKSLTDLNPIFALSLTIPLSFFLCDLVSNITRAVNLHNEEIDEEAAMRSQLSQQEAGESSVFDLEDMSIGRFRNLYRGNYDSDAEEIDSIRFTDYGSSTTQGKRPLVKRFGGWILGVIGKRKAT
jgi:hypothetical protein